MKHRQVLIFVFFSSFIISCGEPVCVMGIGDCDWPGEPQGSTQSSTSRITLSAPKTSLRLNEAVQLTVRGGNPPFTYNLDPSDRGSISRLSNLGRSATFTAPRQIFRQSELIRVQVKDAQGKTSDLDIVVRDSSQ